MRKSCPVCHKPAVVKYAPFCSARCQDIDLGNWAMEKYRVTPKPDDDNDEAPNAAGEDETPYH
jgi:endogenous inhibitor of DNA gyrase (YacG/DUF329 family)